MEDKRRGTENLSTRTGEKEGEDEEALGEEQTKKKNRERAREAVTEEEEWRP